ncbi:MAG: nucleotidyltransferase family protein [Clostridia bacterium]|nr:nucleotidyltransferase family protein [Clostridia bacterium]
MTQAQQILLEQLAASLFGKATDTVITPEVIREARQQAVLTLLPPEENPLFWNVIRQNIKVTIAHQQLHRLMTKHGIPYVTLKGVNASHYYPEPTRRQMGDVDLIVRKEDLERACAAMEAEGFQGHKDMQEHHVRYDTGSSWWELHWRAPGFPENHPIERYVDEMIAQAVERDECMCLQPFHHGLILLTHGAYHWINVGFTLRNLCDWAVLCAHFEEQEFLELFESPLKELGLWKFAQLLMALSIRYLGAPRVSWAEGVDEAYLETLMEDVFLRDSDRVNQAKLITDEESFKVGEKGMVRQFLAVLTRKAYMLWPVCEKYKILLPFGMAAHMVRYVWKIAQGRKPKVNVGNMLAGARKRRELYRPFSLFQPEKE